MISIGCLQLAVLGASLLRRLLVCDQGLPFLAVQRRAAKGFDKASGEV